MHCSVLTELLGLEPVSLVINMARLCRFKYGECKDDPRLSQKLPLKQYVSLCALYLQARVADDRKAVQQADRVGLPLKADGRPGARTQTLTTEFIAESLTVSDLFELNEVASVELLSAGY